MNSKDQTSPAIEQALVWIDATRPAAGRRLWGMNLVERQVRELALKGVRRVQIWVGAQSRQAVEHLRPDFARIYAVDLVFTEVPNGGMGGALGQVQGPLLLLAGDVLYDERVLAHLLQQGPGNLVVGEGGSAALFAAAESLPQTAKLWDGTRDGSWPLEELTKAADGLGLQVQHPADFEHYVPSLRLTMVPFMVSVDEVEDLWPLDYLMYRRTFKGVIDAVARYGYYHLVRWITRQLSATTLPPNLFTLLSVVCIWGAVPCFVLGHLGWGVLVAWCGVLLDSVDGKLARLTLQLSDAMGAFEHIAAMPGLGLWYAALGWHFSAGALFTTHPMALATWALLGVFLLDKIATGSFKKLYGRELFDYAPVDAAFHLIAGRRNTSLLLLTLGLVFDRAAESFALIGLWTAFTLLFHLGRFAWVAVRR